VNISSDIAPAFALGFALGAAPGPVQLLILTETAKRGFGGGVRVMLGANGTLFVVLVALAFGFSSLTAGEGLLRGLRVVGGGFLIYLAVDELRRLGHDSSLSAMQGSPGCRGRTAKSSCSRLARAGQS